MGSWESILDYVDSGLGVGMVPDFIKTRTKRKFHEPTLNSPLNDYKIVIAFKSREHLPEACKSFINQLEKKK